ncbi:MAG: hypothetical protein WC856_02180 [Methylococcaceae bacterium]|jgi:hypothetical protein
MSALVTKRYFSEKTGLALVSAQSILRLQIKKTGTNDKGESLFLKSEVDALAEKYLNGMKPIGDNEITREDIIKKYTLNSKDMARLVMLEGFPKPTRQIMNVDSKKGMQRRVWDAEEVSKVDVDKLLGRNRRYVRGSNADRAQQPFTWQGLAVDIIIFCSGKYLCNNSKLTGYELV